MGQGYGRAKRRQEKLEASKDRLRDLNELIPWERFAEELEKLGKKERKSKAGRKPIDRFKMLILQQLYNLDDLLFQVHSDARHSDWLVYQPL